MPETRIPSTVYNVSQNPASQLHIFVDASMAAMAVVAYLRTTYSQNSHQLVSFLVRKCKFAPLKTNKRAKNGTRSRHYRSAPSTNDPKRNDTDIQPIFCWSESQLVLDSIASK